MDVFGLKKRVSVDNTVPTFAVGDLVDVQSRTWPGINKPGGAGRVLKIDTDNGMLDVKYTLGGSEKAIAFKYVRPAGDDVGDASGSSGRRRRAPAKKATLSFAEQQAREADAAEAAAAERRRKMAEKEAKTAKAGGGAAKPPRANVNQFFASSAGAAKAGGAAAAGQAPLDPAAALLAKARARQVEAAKAFAADKAKAAANEAEAAAASNREAVDLTAVAEPDAKAAKATKLEDEDPPKVEKILAMREKTSAQWADHCDLLNTSKITKGSLFEQDESWLATGGAKPAGMDELASTLKKRTETKYLIKWADLAYIHCTWETRHDLEAETVNRGVDFLKKLRAFEDKQQDLADGTDVEDFEVLLLEHTIVDRVVAEKLAFGGKQKLLLVKWRGLGHADATWEMEGDVRKQEGGPIAIDRYHRRRSVECGKLLPGDREVAGGAARPGDAVAGDDDAGLDEMRTALPTPVPRWRGVPASKRTTAAYKRSALEHPRDFVANDPPAQGEPLFSLRPYQRESVNWMLYNWLQGRSSLLADEMGLGKTLQTVAFINRLVVTQGLTGPFLIIAPLSTLGHWKREFEAWTGLNTLLYHGSAKDRDVMRDHEMFCTDKSGKKVRIMDEHDAAAQRRMLEGNAGVIEDTKETNETKKTPKCRKKHFKLKFQVLITTPEMCISSHETGGRLLASIPWQLMVVDEAQRLKNSKAKLSTTLRTTFAFDDCLLLTGTPIQNNTLELYTLLSFMDNEKFPADGADDFVERFAKLQAGGDEAGNCTDEAAAASDVHSEDTAELLGSLHAQLKPYLLRRLKENVETTLKAKEETIIEVELTTLQKKYYRAIFEKNVGFLQKGCAKKNTPSLMNVVMELRKCCNHPYLIQGVEERELAEEAQRVQGAAPNSDTEQQLASASQLSQEQFLKCLINASGKLVLLDKLLPRLREGGHRVLIFSGFKMMLDLLRDYLHARGMGHECIDGSVAGSKRQAAIDRFSDPKSDSFIMLLTTKAGGVGINLVAADTCIIFDSDWNPQNDIQAMARCHRIGQRKQVKVYRLLTRKSYEMELFARASLKLGLERAVLHGVTASASAAPAGSALALAASRACAQAEPTDAESAARGKTEDNASLSAMDYEAVLKYGAYDIFAEEREGKSDEASKAFCEADIDQILSTRTTTLIDDQGSKSADSNGAGGNAPLMSSFSTASFVAEGAEEGVDISDPEFWTKVVGEAAKEDSDELVEQFDEFGRPIKSRRKAARGRLSYRERREGDIWFDDDDTATDAPSSEMDIDKTRQVDEDFTVCSSVSAERSDMWGASFRDRFVQALLVFGLDNARKAGDNHGPPFDRVIAAARLPKVWVTRVGGAQLAAQACRRLACGYVALLTRAAAAQRATGGAATRTFGAALASDVSARWPVECSNAQERAAVVGHLDTLSALADEFACVRTALEEAHSQPYAKLRAQLGLPPHEELLGHTEHEAADAATDVADSTSATAAKDCSDPHALVGRRIMRTFGEPGQETSVWATVVAYFPEDHEKGAHGIDSWHLVHEDGDEEDVAEEELLVGLVAAAKAAGVLGITIEGSMRKDPGFVPKFASCDGAEVRLRRIEDLEQMRSALCETSEHDTIEQPAIKAKAPIEAESDPKETENGDHIPPALPALPETAAIPPATWWHPAHKFDAALLAGALKHGWPEGTKAGQSVAAMAVDDDLPFKEALAQAADLAEQEKAEKEQAAKAVAAAAEATDAGDDAQAFTDVAPTSTGNAIERQQLMRQLWPSSRALQKRLRLVVLAMRWARMCRSCAAENKLSTAGADASTEKGVDGNVRAAGAMCGMGLRNVANADALAARNVTELLQLLDRAGAWSLGSMKHDDDGADSKVQTELTRRQTAALMKAMLALGVPSSEEEAEEAQRIAGATSPSTAEGAGAGTKRDRETTESKPEQSQGVTEPPATRRKTQGEPAKILTSRRVEIACAAGDYAANQALLYALALAPVARVRIVQMRDVDADADDVTAAGSILAAAGDAPDTKADSAMDCDDDAPSRRELAAAAALSCSALDMLRAAPARVRNNISTRRAALQLSGGQRLAHQLLSTLKECATESEEPPLLISLIANTGNALRRAVTDPENRNDTRVWAPADSIDCIAMKSALQDAACDTPRFSGVAAGTSHDERVDAVKKAAAAGFVILKTPETQGVRMPRSEKEAQWDAFELSQGGCSLLIEERVGLAQRLGGNGPEVAATALVMLCGTASHVVLPFLFPHNAQGNEEGKKPEIAEGSLPAVSIASLPATLRDAISVQLGKATTALAQVDATSGIARVLLSIGGNDTQGRVRVLNAAPGQLSGDEIAWALSLPMPDVARANEADHSVIVDGGAIANDCAATALLRALAGEATDDTADALMAAAVKRASCWAAQNARFQAARTERIQLERDGVTPAEQRERARREREERLREEAERAPVGAAPLSWERIATVAGLKIGTAIPLALVRESGQRIAREAARARSDAAAAVVEAEAAAADAAVIDVEEAGNAGEPLTGEGDAVAFREENSVSLTAAKRLAERCRLLNVVRQLLRDIERPALMRLLRRISTGKVPKSAMMFPGWDQDSDAALLQAAARHGVGRWAVAADDKELAAVLQLNSPLTATFPLEKSLSSRLAFLEREAGRLRRFYEDSSSGHAQSSSSDGDHTFFGFVTSDVVSSVAAAATAAGGTAMAASLRASVVAAARAASGTVATPARWVQRAISSGVLQQTAPLQPEPWAGMVSDATVAPTNTVDAAPAAAAAAEVVPEKNTSRPTRTKKKPTGVRSKKKPAAAAASAPARAPMPTPKPAAALAAVPAPASAAAAKPKPKPTLKPAVTQPAAAASLSNFFSPTAGMTAKPPSPPQTKVSPPVETTAAPTVIDVDEAITAGDEAPKRKAITPPVQQQVKRTRVKKVPTRLTGSAKVGGAARAAPPAAPVPSIAAFFGKK